MNKILSILILSLLLLAGCVKCVNDCSLCNEDEYCSSAISFSCPYQCHKYKTEGKLTQRDVKDKIWDLEKQISEKEVELFVLRQLLDIYKSDLEAEAKGMKVEYQKIPNSTFVIRLEYNGSKISDVEVKKIMNESGLYTQDGDLIEKY